MKTAATPGQRTIQLNNEAQEIWVGANRLCLKENKLVHVNVVGELNEETALELKKAILDLGNMANGNIRVLIDISKAGKVSSSARKMFLSLCDCTSLIEKTALFGAHSVARVLASFILGTSQKKRARFFKTEEDALRWLGQIK